MNTSKLFFAAAIAASIVSCVKEAQDDSTLSKDGITQITAELADSQTKTVLGDDGTSILWSPNDEINVFYNTVSVKFTSLNTEPLERTIFASEKALFCNSTESAAGKEEPWFWGVYPYDAANKSDGESVTMTVPASQTVVAGSFGKDSFAAIGRSKDTRIAFYNVCGGIRFTLTQSGIRRIEIKGNNNEPLAGKVKVAFNESGLPEVKEVIDGQTTIVLQAPDSSEFEVGEWYYASLLPTELASGFSMKFYKGYFMNEIGEKSFTSSREVKRSMFGSAQEIDRDVTFKIHVSQVLLDKYELNLKPLSTEKLTYTIYPEDATDKSVTWKSLDEEIATVSNGVVTALKEGETKIVVTTNDSQMTDTCTVYCEEKSKECALKALVATNGKYTLAADIFDDTAEFTVYPEDMDKFTAVTLTATVSDKATSDVKATAYNLIDNEVTITVTAENGRTTKTYQVIVTEVRFAVFCSQVWEKSAAELPTTAVNSYLGCSVAFSGTENIVLLDGSVLDMDGNSVGSLNLTGCPSYDEGIRSLMNDENGVLVATFGDTWNNPTSFEVYAWMNGWNNAPVKIFTEQNSKGFGAAWRHGDCAGALGTNFVMAFAGDGTPGAGEGNMLFYVFDYGTSIDLYECAYYSLETVYPRGDGNWSQVVSPVSGDINGRWFIGDSRDFEGWACYTRVGYELGTDTTLYGTLDEYGGESLYGNYSGGYVNAFKYNNTEYVAVTSTGWASTYFTIQTADPQADYLLPTQEFAYGTQDPYSQYVYNAEDDCGYVVVVSGSDGSESETKEPVSFAALYKIERCRY